MNAIALDTETTGANFLGGVDTPFVLYGCDFDGHKIKWEWEYDPAKRKAIPNKAIAKDIVEYVDSYDHLVFHNAKFDLRALETMGVELDWRGRVEDTMIMSHVLNNIGSHGLKDLAKFHLLRKNDEQVVLKEAVKKARSIARRDFPEWKLGAENKGGKDGDTTLLAVDYWILKAIAKEMKYPKSHPWWTLCDKYGFGDVIRTIELFYTFSHGIKVEELGKPYQREIELLESSLYDMEGQGINVIPSNLKKSLKDYKAIREGLEEKLLAISPVNWKSGKELPLLLFGEPKKIEDENGVEVVAVKVGNKIQPSTELGKNQNFKPLFVPSSRKDSFNIPPIKLTKSRLNYSTDKYVLKELLDAKLPPKPKRYLNTLMDWKDVEKAIQQLETIEDHLRHDFRVHTNYKQTGTKTTRVSASNPNTQQISKGKEFENEDGEKATKYKIREVFGPTKGRVWYAIDYSQLQLRIFAYIANERGFIESLEAGYDAHAYVASRIYEKAIDSITAHERRIAKNVNFGFIFGASPAKIEETAGVNGLWDTVMKLFPSAHAFMKQTKREVREKGYVTTPFGYRLWLPYGSYGKRAEHAGVNYKVQGCEGDIVKNAMIKVSKYLRSKQLKVDMGSEPKDVKMIFQVHDELVFDFPKEIKKGSHRKALRKITQLMEEAGTEMGMKTPVDIDVHTRNWDAKVKNHPYSIGI
tara:strand:+ start:3814 stop:5898 length:2085 start_codon:yes stop_codon:yes gene_type:complete